MSELTLRLAVAAVKRVGEQVGFALLFRVAVALAGALDARNLAALGPFLPAAFAAAAIGGFVARRTGSASVAEAAAAIASGLGAVDDVVFAARSGAGAVGAHLAQAVFGALAPFARFARCATASAVDAGLAFVERTVVAARRLAEALDAQAFVHAIAGLNAALPEAARLAVLPAAVEVRLAGIGIETVVRAVLGLGVLDELVFVGGTGRRHPEAQASK